MMDTPDTDKSQIRYTYAPRRGSPKTYPNAYDVNRQIAERLRASGLGLSPYGKHALDNALDHPSAIRAGSMCFELERAGLRVTLYVGVDEYASMSVHDDASDSDGNRFMRQTKVKAEVNWSAIGSRDAASALVYAKLLQDAALFCAEITTEFDGKETFICWKTAEESRREKQATFEESLRNWARDSRKNLRVGKERSQSFDGRSELTEELRVGEKVYKLTCKVSDDTDGSGRTHASLVRVA